MTRIAMLAAAGAAVMVLGGVAPTGGAESLSAGTSLFAPEKRYAVGDLITVVISERAQGGQRASTELHKETEMGLSTSGLVATMVGSAGAGIRSKQSGGGDLSRSGQMSGTLTARVVEVLQDGNLFITGEQAITFDSGRQRIALSGIARPRDISAANEIPSYRLADANIEYLGRDALNEKARTGYISRFLEWLWIF